MSRMLAEVDPEIGALHHRALREAFLARPAGIPGIREYPRGASGRGDVDSGPLVLGLSASATVVAAAAALAHGDEATARTLLQAGEVVGLPVQLAGTRRYAGGLVPVGDAFLAWTRTTPPSPHATRWSPALPRRWAWPLHLGTLALALGWIASLRPRRDAHRPR